MQFVIFHPFLAHRLKCSQPHVQRDFRGFNAARFDASQNFRREVQTCGRRGHRTLFAGVDGLVALAVRRLVLAVDVWRQRDVANALDDGKEIRHGKKANAALSEAAAGDHFRLQLPQSVLVAEK